ncbi:MAG: TonB-dependent receptor [Gemmatimonadales bacterium]|nr:MAG: TonB-dependent receptor [Gemmatimonadales bacterium]
MRRMGCGCLNHGGTRILGPVGPVGAVALALLSSAEVGAQVRDSAQVADTVVAVRLPPVVVTVSRTPVRADRVGSAVAVVAAEDLRTEPPRYAFESLRDLPGSYVDEGAGPGGPTIVRIRGGEEVHTQILLDGIQVNQTGGFFDMQGLALSNLERVEVARGPQSAAWGSSAMSGVVQFITPRGRPGPARFRLRAEGGGASEFGGSFRTEVGASGGTETLQYSAGAGVGLNRGVFELPHDTWTGDASLRVDYLPSLEWEVSTTLRYLRYQGRLPVRDPGATRVPLDPNARNERDRLATSLQARYSPSARWSHQLRADLYRDDFLFQDEFDALDPADYPFFVFDADLDFTERLLRPRLEYQGSVRAAAGEDETGAVLTFGSLWEYSDVDQSLSGAFGDSELAFDRQSGAAFAEVLWDVVPRWSTMVGVRVEKFEGIPAEVTPRLNTVIRPAPGLVDLRVAWGLAYKVPSLSQQYQENDFIAPNPELEPERSRSWEVGLDLTPMDRRLRVELTYFDQRFEDLIRTVALEGSNRNINRNLGRSRARGVEWSATLQTHPRFAVGSSGAWVDTEILENSGLNPEEYPLGEALPFRPNMNGSLFIEFLASRGLRTFLRGSYVGPQTVLSERFSGDRVELDPHFVLDATVRFEPRAGVSFYARVENLLARDYLVAFDRPGIPVRASVGVQWEN